MPLGFDQCRKEGGRIRTIKPREDVYLHICWDKSGKSHAGEVKHVKSPKKSYKKRQYWTILDDEGVNRNKLYIGPRGGKYVLVNGKKIYVRT